MKTPPRSEPVGQAVTCQHGVIANCGSPDWTATIVIGPTRRLVRRSDLSAVVGDRRKWLNRARNGADDPNRKSIKVACRNA